MLALYTNRGKYKVTNTDTHSQNMFTCAYCLYTRTNTLLVMNNITYDSFRGRHLAVITPFGSTSKQKMDHHTPNGRGIDVPEQATWQHGSKPYTPLIYQTPKNPVNPVNLMDTWPHWTKLHMFQNVSWVKFQSLTLTLGDSAQNMMRSYMIFIDEQCKWK